MNTLPTLTAELHFPPGVDRNDMTVTDDTGRAVARTSCSPLTAPGWRRGTVTSAGSATAAQRRGGPPRAASSPPSNRSDR